MFYQLTIPGEPVGKARPRVVTTKSGRSLTYTPAKTGMQEKLIWYLFKEKYPDAEVDSESLFRLEIKFAVTPYKNGKRRKFDIDNGLKLVMDALTGIVWADDNQVDSALVYRQESENPFTSVEVESDIEL